MEKQFINGFDSWHEAHFEIVKAIDPEREGSKSKDWAEQYGTGGLYDLAYEMTDKFEYEHAGREWDGEFFETIEAFCIENNL